MKTGRRLIRLQQRQDPAAEKDGMGISPGDIADHNSRAALSLIRTHGALTCQELSARLGLTEPAVTGIMKRLGAQGLVSERKRTGAARYHAAEFGLRPAGAHALGVAVAPDGVRIALVDLSGRTVAERHLAGPGETARLPEALAALLAEAGPAHAPLGLGIATAPGCAVDLEKVRRHCPDLPVFLMPDTEAAVNAERMLGLGEPDGGLVVILVDDSVRAGLFIGGKVFRGMHGRAGQIGGMRPGRQHASLDAVAGRPAYLHAVSRGTQAVDAWIGSAAGRLLDAVVAISGFVSPGAVLIGGALPDAVCDALVARMLIDREEQASYFVAASWIPPIRRVSLSGAGITLGAAMAPFMELLLPKAP